ncbi:uncharacterized protein LOC143151977 [Ptiloglossa arizonensis]|uniref:uncharacterized protein LOC143151977 n=1 Tax=Ptiloglossa arizonensis TaxID=3350558 RepID=UPI003FA004DF
MYVTETGGHRVAPVTTKAKMVEYKAMNETTERGGGGGGGTHLAATVKNTVRRLLRRTKSHRDAPAVNVTTNTTTQTTHGNHANNIVNVRNKPNNANEPNARRSQPPLPPSFEQHSRGNSYVRRLSRPRVRLQKPVSPAATGTTRTARPMRIHAEDSSAIPTNV